MRRVLALGLTLIVLACAACGGGAPRSDNADVLALNQPTPDPTLDAVVRDLPKALAGIAPTPTSTPLPVVPKPAVKQSAAPTPTPPPKPAPTRKPAPSPTTAAHH